MCAECTKKFLQGLNQWNKQKPKNEKENNIKKG